MFNGTAVYFMTYGHLPNEETLFKVSIDGEEELRSLQIDPINGIHPQFIAYGRTGLDASRVHTIKITDPEKTDLNIDAFM
jgi:hypothetical protein